MDYAAALLPKIAPHIASIANTYVWPEKKSSKREATEPANPRLSYDRRLALVAEICTSWKHASDDKERVVLAQRVIRDWGGISNNKEARVQQFVAAAHAQKLNVFTNIASYSKLLSFIDPTRYAIYDSRVAIMLNLAALETKPPLCYYFPVPPARSGTEIATLSVLFTDRMAKQLGWQLIKPSDAYPTYLALINAIAEAQAVPLYDVEMALFQLAPIEAEKINSDLADRAMEYFSKV